MKQHPLCTDPDSGPCIYDLPIAEGIKREWALLRTRRHFLGKMGNAIGWAGLATLLGKTGFGSSTTVAGLPPGMLHLPNYAPQAKRAIYLFMSGAPPQMDMWDYKPGLAAMYDKDLPDSVRGNQRVTGMTAGQARFPIAPSHWKFSQAGKAGMWISELLPWTSKIVDDLTVIKSLQTDAINHEPAILLMNTGNMNQGHPCMGSWLSYGLGSMNDNLPTFVVLLSKLLPGTANQPVSPRLWSSGHLSSEYAGVALRSAGDPVLYLKDPRGIDRSIRRTMLDSVAQANHATFDEIGDPETNARISQYEMAYRMQASVPDLADLTKEPQSTWDLYGPEAKEPGTFAYNCLMARRMAERGVRFTQVYQRGWDVHGDVVGALPKLCGATDRGCYALITDLKQRGLLDDTLVIWGGEFGRTVYSQGGLSATNYGRDHHPRCFTMWMTGGGIKSGFSYGETDDFSYNTIKDPVHVRDLNASILHTLGIDHEKLTAKFQGLEDKLTGTLPAKVIHDLFA
jgi:hypothetical protein